MLSIRNSGFKCARIDSMLELQIFKNREGEIMINEMINWLHENRDWLFSGIGVTILVGIVGLVRNRFTKKSNDNKSIKIEQRNEGDNITQIGIQNNYYGGNRDDR